MFTIVLVMNAINFIDGLDGLVAGVALIANGVFFLYTYLLVQQTSPLNYFNLASLLADRARRARASGSCRSTGIRRSSSWATRARCSSACSWRRRRSRSPARSTRPSARQLDELFPAFIPIILPFAVLIIPLLDFGLAVVRRLRAGKSPFAADRKHLHHRLLDMGHSHLHAVLIFYAWTAVASIGCLLSFVFPVYLGIDSGWAFLLLGDRLPRLRRDHARPARPPQAPRRSRPRRSRSTCPRRVGARRARAGPELPVRTRRLESGDPELEHDDRRTS